MGSLSNYLENELLDHTLKTGEYTAPTVVAVALSTADPTEDGSGVAEPSSSSYVRATCATWDLAGTSRTTENGATITFNEATGVWGTITHFAVYDATSAGNMLIYGEFTASKVVSSGDNMSVSKGDIDVTVNASGMSNYLAGELLDHVFRGDSFVVPGSIFVALTTADPTDVGVLTEPAGGAYTRISCATWDVASLGATENTTSITFTTATESWGTISHVTLVDQSATSGGNMLFYGKVDTAKVVGTGDTAKWDAGAFDITLT